MLKNMLLKIMHLVGSLFGSSGRNHPTPSKPATLIGDYVGFAGYSGTRSINSLKRKRAKRARSLISNGYSKEALRYAR